MKHFYFLILAVFTTNMAVAQYTITDVSLNGQSFKKITGTINADQTLNDSFLWIIADSLKVSPVGNLTITAGTKIFAETPATILYVSPLGEVDWQGTSTNPIIFNSLANAPGQGVGNTTPGQWTGIRIDGDGAVSNSGTIRYVRQMYAGFGDSTNSFQLDNIGSGLTVEYVQVFKNANRGFRINSGAVNLKYLISTNSSDIGFRLDEGWSGFGQFWVVNKNINAGNSIEARGGDPTLSNITITGVGLNNSGATPAGGGIRVRSGGNAKIYNTVVTGVDTSLRFSDGSDAGVTSGDSFFRNSAAFANNINSGTGFHSSAATFNPTNGSYNATFNNSVLPFAIVDSYVGTSTLNSIPAGPLNPFFTDVNYVGAVQSGVDNDWTAGWCLNLDGTLREAPLSVNESNKTAFAVYPNPVKDYLKITSSDAITSVFMFDSTGKLMYKNLSFDLKNNQIDMSQYQSGIYFVKVTTGNISETLKVLKQ